MMKKLLIIVLLMLVVNSLTLAQGSNTKSEKLDTIAAVVTQSEVSLESVSEKIDQFMESQSKTNANLEEKIDRANRRMQSFQNESSWRWLFRDLIPLFIFVVVGAIVVVFVYFITNNNYRNNMAKYDTIVKCVEKTGTAPDFFYKVEQQKSISVSSGGRVHLILSIVCCVIALIFLVAAINCHGFIERVLSLSGASMFFFGTFILFKQYNQISEDNRKKQ